jgi:hypothetical protein
MEFSMTLKKAVQFAVMLFAGLFKTAVVVPVVITGCGKPVLPQPGWFLPAECDIAGGRTASADSVTVALLDAVEPEHAPHPRNPSERILFRHLYETMIRIDCMGEVRPALAASWDGRKGGRVWKFELSKEARFWDGSPVTARDVAGCWEKNKNTLLAYDIDSTSTESDRVLYVHFGNAHKKIPRLFSSPDLSVAKPAADSKWPLGSGPFQIVTSKRESSGMFKRTITVYPHHNREGPVILFVEAVGYDARDLIDRVVDVMVTMDRSVIDFAAGQPHLETVALPWDRTYVLVSASRLRELRRGNALGAITPELSEELARDAVRNEARPYSSPGWWEELDHCGILDRIVTESVSVTWDAITAADSPRILYDAQDPVSRDLAERIIALAMTDPDASPAAAALIAAVPDVGVEIDAIVAQGMDEVELAKQVYLGTDFAYIISIPARVADPCAEARKLIARYPRVAGMQEDFIRIFVPLVETRSYVIANSDRIGLSVDWYGNVVIMNRLER